MKKYLPKFFSTQTPRELEFEQKLYAHKRRVEELYQRHLRHEEEMRRRAEEAMERLKREAFLKTTQSLYN